MWQSSMMDTDMSDINSLGAPLISRRRRAYGPETSGGHQLTDPSPPAESKAAYI